MQFTIQREQFLKPLQRVIGAVEKKQTLPILSNVLLVLKNQRLSLTATDLEVELKAHVSCLDYEEEGATTLPARKLMDITKALPESAQMTIVIKDDKATLRCGRSRYSLATMSAEDFPKVEEGPGELEFSLKQEAIRKLIGATSFAMAQQDVRYFLNGMYMEFLEDKVQAVATDGHRLAMLSLKAKHSIENLASVIVPRKAVLEMQRLFAEGDEEVGLVVGKNHLRAITTEFSFSTKLIDGKFPDYRRVMPNAEQHSALIERQALKKALTRVAVLFTDKYRGAAFHFADNMIKICATNAEREEVEEELEVRYQGPEQEIGFNISYIVDYISNVQAPWLKISIASPNHSVLFEAVDEQGEVQEPGLYIVMPMRL